MNKAAMISKIVYSFYLINRSVVLMLKMRRFGRCESILRTNMRQTIYSFIGIAVFRHNGFRCTHFYSLDKLNLRTNPQYRQFFETFQNSGNKKSTRSKTVILNNVQYNLTIQNLTISSPNICDLYSIFSPSINQYKFIELHKKDRNFG